MRPQHLYSLLFLVLGVFASGCSAKMPAPDLVRLYGGSQTEAVHTPPVVLIHGIMGSRIAEAHTQKEIWPGSFWRILLSDYDDVALKIDPQTLTAAPENQMISGLFTEAIGKDFYGEILKALEKGGYSLAHAGTPATAQSPQKRTYYVFLYDWRQDNVTSAQKLAAFIDQIKKDHKNPDLKLDIVAHSMGGLVARYYMRYGRQDVVYDNHFDQKLTLEGAKNIRRMLLLGTPNWGSVQALKTFIEGRKVGLGHVKPETLATMPGLMQLFPHPIMAEKTLLTQDGAPLTRDLYDVDIWRRFGWSVFDPTVRKRILKKAPSPEEGAAKLLLQEAFLEKSLERARRFAWSLSIPLPENHPKFIVFGGDCLLTPSRLVVEEVGGVSMVRLSPENIANPKAGIDYQALMLEPGDGSVTKASLLARQTFLLDVTRHKYSFFPLDYSFFLCTPHHSITGNIDFQNNLLHALLSTDR